MSLAQRILSISRETRERNDRLFTRLSRPMLHTSLDITTYYYLEIIASFHLEGNAQRLSSVILFIGVCNDFVN